VKILVRNRRSELKKAEENGCQIPVREEKEASGEAHLGKEKPGERVLQGFRGTEKNGGGGRFKKKKKHYKL